MTRYFAVMIGGAIGAASRFALGTAVGRLYAGPFPLGTFVINVTGSLLIGFLMGFFVNRPAVDAHFRLFLVTGILGGYTTFSSFEWEALASLRNGTAGYGVLYLASSVLLGLAGAWVGLWIANRIWPQ